MHTFPYLDSGLLIPASIAWFYVLANALRVFTYMPQIIAAWRSQDGARALSLLTWSGWLVANLSSVLYGVLLRDAFLTLVSLSNFAGCATVTVIAVHRRRSFAAGRSVGRAMPAAESAGAATVSPEDFDDTAADAHLHVGSHEAPACETGHFVHDPFAPAMNDSRLSAAIGHSTRRLQ